MYFFFCSNSEENCFPVNIFPQSWILHFATIQKAYAQVNICYRERFIDKLTHSDLLMLQIFTKYWKSAARCSVFT